MLWATPNPSVSASRVGIRPVYDAPHDQKWATRFTSSWAKPERAYVEEVERDPGKLRIAICAEHWGPVPIQKHITEQVHQVARLLEQAGHSIEEAAPGIDYEAYLEVFRRIWAIDISAMLDYEAEEIGRKISADPLEPMTLRMYEAGRNATASERLGISAFMSQTGRQLGAFFEDYDLLLTPVMTADTPSLGSPLNLVQEGQKLDDWFDHAFALRLVVRVGASLDVDLHVTNTGDQVFDWSGALHSYLATHRA